jgi:hypothetical protein
VRVISFKVDDGIYAALRKKKVSFRSLFEPLAIQLAQNNRRQMKYTGCIRKNSSDPYSDLSQVKKTIEKIMKFYENKDIEVKP